MMRIELKDEERKVLESLARSGAMSPSALAAEMLILPGNAAELLKKLTDEGLVLMRDDTDSADGKLVALSADARDLLDTGSARQMKR